MSIFPSYIVTNPAGESTYYSAVSFTKYLLDTHKQSTGSKKYQDWCKKQGILKPIQQETIQGTEATKGIGVYLMAYLVSCGYKFEEI